LSGNKSESDPEFVRKTIKSHHDCLQKQRELIKVEWDLERLVQYVMSLLKISQEEILSKTKKEEAVAARSLICHLLKRKQEGFWVFLILYIRYSRWIPNPGE